MDNLSTRISGSMRPGGQGGTRSGTNRVVRWAGMVMVLVSVLAVAIKVAFALTYAGPVTVTPTTMGDFSPNPVGTKKAATSGLSAGYVPPSGVPEGDLSAQYDWSVSQVQYKATWLNSQGNVAPYGTPPADSYTDSISPTQPAASSGATLTFTPLIAGYWQISTGCSVTVTDTTTNQYWSGSGNAGPEELQSLPDPLKSVTFSGTGYEGVLQDNGNAYGSPQWVDNSNPPNGNATDSGDDDFPVCYLRNTDVVAKPVFTMVGAGSGSYEIKGTGAAAGGVSLTFPPTNASFSGGTLTATLTSSNALPNLIEDLSPLTINWEYSPNGGKSWIPDGASANRVYVILAKPVGNVQLYESVLDISCRNAAGTAVVATAVADIWKNFQSAPHSNPVQGVKRKAIDGYNVADGVEMTYWNPVVNSCQSMAAMLASANGDGTCVAWSSLFQATLEVQGITGTSILEITADQNINPNADGFLVKNWNFGKHIRTGPNGVCDSKTAGDDVALIKFGDGFPDQVCITAGPDGKLDEAPAGDDVVSGNTITTGPDGICQTKAAGDDVQVIPVGQGEPNEPCIGPGPDGVLNSTAGGDDTVQDGLYKGTNYPYLLGFDAADQIGVPGQMNVNPPGAFENHFVVDYNNAIYDPSYGNGPFVGNSLAAAELAHEQASIDGIYALAGYDSNNNPIYVAKKATPNVNELDYAPMP